MHLSTENTLIHDFIITMFQLCLSILFAYLSPSNSLTDENSFHC